MQDAYSRASVETDGRRANQFYALSSKLERLRRSDLAGQAHKKLLELGKSVIIINTHYTPCINSRGVVLVKTSTLRTERRLRKGMYTFEEFLEKAESGESDDVDLADACWKGYEAVGTKKKGGKTVPNCVPKKKT